MKLDGRETVQYVVGQMLDPVVREEVVNTCLIVHDENGRELPPDAKGTFKCPSLGTMEYENGTARPLPTPAQKRTLSDIQTEQLLWSERNFGNHPAWHPLLGIQEEAGELAHAFLKRTQGIRKNQDHDAAIRDAVGDIVIYLMDFCSCEGIDLQEAIEGAWDTVRKRNWKAAPTSGMEAKQ